MKKTVHIIPVGHTKTTLTEGMRQFPFHKIVLVLGKETGPGEERAEAVARQIEEEFGSVAEVETIRVDADDVYSSAIAIAEKIVAEENRGSAVKVNASGSLRTVGISCYLACAVTDAELYVALPAYKEGKLTGIRRLLDIPSFPLKGVGSEELAILRFLATRRSMDSVDDLIQGVVGIEKNSSGYQKERARMSYHIKKLREGGFIETNKQGKNLTITLTKLGELYSIGKAKVH
jgi:DNA-binding transcriptional ArsR family regulator